MQSAISAVQRLPVCTTEYLAKLSKYLAKLSLALELVGRAHPSQSARAAATTHFPSRRSFRVLTAGRNGGMPAQKTQRSCCACGSNPRRRDVDGVPPTSGGEPSRESRPRGETLSKRHAQPDASTAVAAEPEVGVSGTAARAIGVAPSQRSEAHDTQLDRSTAFLQQRAQRMAAFSLSLGRADAPTAAAGSEVGASDNAARATDVAPSPQALRGAAAQPRPARGSGSRGETEVGYDRESGTHAHEPTLECQPAGEFEPRAEVTSHTQPDTPNAAAEPEVDASGNAARATDEAPSTHSDHEPQFATAKLQSASGAESQPARGSKPRDGTPPKRHPQPDTPTAAAALEVGVHGTAAGATVSTKAQWQRASAKAKFLVNVAGHHVHDARVAEAQYFAPTTQGGSGKPPPLKKRQSNDWASEAQAPELALESQLARGSKPRGGTPPKRHPQPDTPAF